MLVPILKSVLGPVWIILECGDNIVDKCVVIEAITALGVPALHRAQGKSCLQ